MVSEAVALLGLFVTLGLGIAFGAATVLVAHDEHVPGTIAGLVVTASFFTAAFLLAKFLGV